MKGTRVMSNTNNILHWNMSSISEAIKNKQISPLEIVKRQLKNINEQNQTLNAFVTVLSENALSEADKAEKEMMAGNFRGPLHGIPIGLKDLIFTKGIKTTMGSGIYRDFVPDIDATVVKKLKNAGAIMIGKLNTHEFAYGTTGDRSFIGAVKNPYNPSYISGGSSSGSGAAVAASMCYGALGTDTGGSIRIPASCCGIVGMKPTFGRVSKYGIYPLSWTLDHVGPMTRTVKDNAMLLSVLAGYDKNDPYSLKNDTEDFSRYLGESLKGTKIGVPSTFYFENIEDEVNESVEKAIDIFKSLGAETCKIDIPDAEQTSDAHRLTLKSEAYAVNEKIIQENQRQMDSEVKERFLTGEDVKAYEYAQTQHLKQTVIHQLYDVYQDVDVILTPTLSTLPIKIRQRDVSINGLREHSIAFLNRLTGPMDLIGFPSLSIPCGISSQGTPIGLQMIGKPLDEANLYRFGYVFEREYSIESPPN